MIAAIVTASVLVLVAIIAVAVFVARKHTLATATAITVMYTNQNYSPNERKYNVNAPNAGTPLLDPPPHVPQNLRVVARTTTEATLQWQIPENEIFSEEYNYLIAYYTNSGLESARTKLFRKIDATTRAITVTDLSPNKLYKFQVRSRNSLDESAPALTDPIRMLILPNPPTDVNIIDMQPNELLIRWQASANEDATTTYIVEISENSGAYKPADTSEMTRDGKFRFVTIRNLVYHYNYVPRVTARNSDGSSEPVMARRLSANPSAPINFGISKKLYNSITKRVNVSFYWQSPMWRSNSDNISYILQRSDPQQTWVTVPVAIRGTGGNFQATMTGLLPGVSYTFRIMAKSPTGTSYPRTTERRIL